MIPLENAYITSIYGKSRADGKIHKGLDLISKSNDKNVKAIKPGIVSFVGYDEYGFGNYVSIQQEDNYRTLYCHLNSYNVKIGEKIKEGQIIGIEGTTGNSSGVHLHLEIRKSPFNSDDHINPADYLGIENRLGFIIYIESEDDKMLQRLIDEFGEDIVYNALKNICYKEKNKNIVPNWAKEDYNDAINEGITDGSRPQSLATRVETAVMIERAMDQNESNS